MEKKKEEKENYLAEKNGTKNGLKYSRISIFFGLSNETCHCKNMPIMKTEKSWNSFSHKND